MISLHLKASKVCIIYFFVRRDVHFDKKNDILLKWFIEKSRAEPIPQKSISSKYHIKDLKILFIRNPMICFYVYMNRLKVIIGYENISLSLTL